MKGMYFMVAKFVFDPIHVLLSIFNENCPEKEVEIFYGDMPEEHKDSYAYTYFPEDTTIAAAIIIKIDQSISDVVEGLARELAHVMEGYNPETAKSPIWQEHYEHIYKQYAAHYTDFNSKYAEKTHD
jgi:hypothetical protein